MPEGNCQLFNYHVFTLVLVGMLLNKETVVSVVIGIVFLTAVTLYYLIRYHKKERQI